MNSSCDQIRDVMPELIAGRLATTEAARVRAHIEHCAECQSELELASLIAGRRYALASGFEQRVVAATANRRVRVWSGWRVALAASIAVAVIGGSALLPYLRSQPAAPEVAVEVNQPAAGGAGFLGIEDAFKGGPSLNDLSIQELEKLLAELDS